ncbi:uncharacterized protein LOC143275500 [Babylonia areolata]|uniref:uncharacterized protein LOC143275500 n=1 Tax=Babylonia areolata TaxID=304850 RepID=UPI003FD4E784
MKSAAVGVKTAEELTPIMVPPSSFCKQQYQCRVCMSVFSNRWNCVSHMRAHQRVRPVLECSVCGKKCSKQSELEIHVRIHTGEKPFSCSVCHRRFTRQGQLNSHMRSHSGVKSFLCCDCGASFVNSSNLKRHHQLHAKNRNKPPLTYPRFSENEVEGEGGGQAENVTNGSQVSEEDVTDGCKLALVKFLEVQSSEPEQDVDTFEEVSFQSVMETHMDCSMLDNSESASLYEQIENFKAETPLPFFSQPVSIPQPVSIAQPIQAIPATLPSQQVIIINSFGEEQSPGEEEKVLKAPNVFPLKEDCEDLKVGIMGNSLPSDQSCNNSQGSELGSGWFTSVPPPPGPLSLTENTHLEPSSEALSNLMQVDWSFLLEDSTQEQSIGEIAEHLPSELSQPLTNEPAEALPNEPAETLLNEPAEPLSRGPLQSVPNELSQALPNEASHSQLLVHEPLQPLPNDPLPLLQEPLQPLLNGLPQPLQNEPLQLLPNRLPQPLQNEQPSQPLLNGLPQPLQNEQPSQPLLNGLPQPLQNEPPPQPLPSETVQGLLPSSVSLLGGTALRLSNAEPAVSSAVYPFSDSFQSGAVSLTDQLSVAGMLGGQAAVLLTGFHQAENGLSVSALPGESIPSGVVSVPHLPAVSVSPAQQNQGQVLEGNHLQDPGQVMGVNYFQDTGQLTEPFQSSGGQTVLIEQSFDTAEQGEEHSQDTGQLEMGHPGETGQVVGHFQDTGQLVAVDNIPTEAGPITGPIIIIMENPFGAQLFQNVVQELSGEEEAENPMQVTFPAQPTTLQTSAAEVRTPGISIHGHDYTNTEEPPSPQKKQLEKTLACDLCPRRFARQWYLTVHRKSHLRERLHTCEVCQVSFTRVGNLNRHRLMHTGDKPFQCQQCPSRFANRYRLAEHERRHEGLKPFRCDVCNNQFTDLSSLRRHKRTHSGEDLKHTCEICGASFKTMHSLTSHLKVHIKEEGFGVTVDEVAFTPADVPVVPFDPEKETVSETSTRPPSVLKVVKKTTTTAAADPDEFRCSICHKTFPFSTACRQHIFSHLGARPYRCTDCGVTFSRKACARRHTETHRREKRNRCGQCGRRFQTRPQLLLHEDEHLPPEALTEPCDECDRRFSQGRLVDVHKRIFHRQMLCLYRPGVGIVRRQRGAAKGKKKSSKKNRDSAGDCHRHEEDDDGEEGSVVVVGGVRHEGSAGGGGGGGEVCDDQHAFAAIRPTAREGITPRPPGPFQKGTMIKLTRLCKTVIDKPKTTQFKVTVQSGRENAAWAKQVDV